jgi:tRNA(Ile)-lysidine synthase
MTVSLPQALASFQPGLPLAVALSGGADSTALFVACVQRWPGQIRAVHINHGLQTAATQFEAHCLALCAQWAVPLVVIAVNARATQGQSPEDAARNARYAALAKAVASDPVLEGVRDVALAQHADDQVETLLLALSRGAGLPGLSSMPATWQRDNLQWHRPLLGVAGPDVRNWLSAQDVAWVEDPTNQDPRYTRNRIRAQILPALDATFTGWRDTLARSASHCAQAQEVLNELAQMDLLATGVPPRIVALQALSPARRVNLLRYWLRQYHRTAPSTAQLEALVPQILACTTRGHQLHLKVGGGFLERRGEALQWLPQA